MRRLADNGLAALIGRPVVHTGASALITEPQEVVDYARRVDRKIDGLQDDFAQVLITLRLRSSSLSAFGSPLRALSAVSTNPCLMFS